MRESSSMSPALRRAFVAWLRLPDGPSEVSMVKAGTSTRWGGVVGGDAVERLSDVLRGPEAVASVA